MLAFDAPSLGLDPSGCVFGSLRLARSPRIGAVTFGKMLVAYGSADRALAALPYHAESRGIRNYRLAPIATVRAELERAAAAGAVALVRGQRGYPAALAALADAPPVLWALGRLELLTRDAVAVVGARNASALGHRMAERLAIGLGAAGFVVTSGLARGVDRSAHLASLETGTIAIFAGGVDQVYPQQNAGIAERIRTYGLILSEAPMGLSPRAQDFPRRNRIVSGLSRAVVLIEAGAKSGSLITARMALDQGREVMAVPGSPLDARAAGCNDMIRQGAVLVRSAEDILDALDGPQKHPSDQGPLPELHAPLPEPEPVRDAPLPGTTAQMLLGLLSAAPVPEDTLIRQLGLTAPQVMEALLELELAGLIDRYPGGLVSARVVA